MTFDVTIDPRQPRDELIREMVAGDMPQKIADVNADLCIEWVKNNPDSRYNLRFESGKTL